MQLDDLLERPPQLHVDRHGKRTSWRVSDDLLRCLDAQVAPGAVTLETGAGLSTILFAIRECRHTAVAPDERQAERIVTWCEANGIATESLSFVTESSERALPTMSPEPLDLVLIDGAHGFPSPFIDWYYAGLRLGVGGLLVIDDTQIWTGKVLRDFLSADDAWTLDTEKKLEFAAFRRVQQTEVGEWLEQPYVIRRSYTPNSTHLGRRLLGMTSSSARHLSAGLRLIGRGEFATLRQRIRG